MTNEVWPCVTCCGVFVLLQFCTWKKYITFSPTLVEKYRFVFLLVYPDLRRVFNNRFYSLGSLSVAVLTALFLWQWTQTEDICSLNQDTPGISYLFWVYYLSKFWEMQDILIWMLLGNTPALHFAFHHNTTPILAFVSINWGSAGKTSFFNFSSLQKTWR